MMSASQALKQHPIHVIAHILVIIGALNWLSVGLLQHDLVMPLLGKNSRYIYILVGIAGVFLTYCMIKLFLGHTDSLASTASANK